jgi:superfamily II helicase
MEMTSELEDRLVKLDKDLHEILHLTGKRHSGGKTEEEIQNLRELVKRIGSHRIEEKDTTQIIREMREKSYDV